ncbi:hypothetical protein [Alkaliphilus transvaalensis]|uniref:hypothetical protein n=1 Tax=Alkaliphilus transvaalensis TaxID=114628 RepID=UPI000479F2DC|nr:hypothetical protein [Alkaliphilus transvaalensis]
MKSIIIGNGVIIQFGGSKYSNKSIIKRALKNISSGNFPKEIYPVESGMAIKMFAKELRSVLAGAYDQYVYTDIEKQSLGHIKARYSQAIKYKPEDIGLEDYFFIGRVVCNKLVPEPEIRKASIEGLWCPFIDSIYNNGEIETVHSQFTNEFVSFLQSFDNIFTTNYDSNIDSVVKIDVHHLHGSFKMLSDVYNHESLRNKLPDAPIKIARVIEGYEHLYSNAILDFSGENKKWKINMGENANVGIRKLVYAYKTNPKVKADVDSWAQEDNKIVRQMYNSVIASIENPEAIFANYYDSEKLSTIEGEFSILGLSPNNDLHIFEEVIANEKVEKIIYYYHRQGDFSGIQTLFNNKEIEFKPSASLWDDFK